MQKILFPLLLAFTLLRVSAQTPTWADNVAPILYNHCTSCHHTGGIGAFPLMTYADATLSYIHVEDPVQTREMPPWKPDPNYRHFKDENVLSTAEIATIVDWANAGKPQGNPANAPQMPVYSLGSQLANIDVSISTASYTVAGQQDEYRSFVIPSTHTSPVYLNQIEYLPGNPGIVHHVVLYYDPTTFSQNLDNSDPGPGFTSYGVGPLNSQSIWIGAWAPGQDVNIFPGNMGILVPVGVDYVVEIHYAPGNQGQQDLSTVNVAYTATTPVRQIYTDPILDYQNDLLDGPLFIPANTVKTFHQQDGIGSSDISLIGTFPHMHRVGSSYKIFSTLGTDTIPLIDIPKWDFHWQGYYTFQTLTKIPANSLLHGVATYDNTVNNEDNPSTPPQDVSAGEHTTDEMMVGFFTYTNYLPGDENIILDSTLLVGISPAQNDFARVLLYPNPTTSEVNLQLDIKKSTDLTIEIASVLGQILEKSFIAKAQTGRLMRTFSLANYPAGIYLVKVQTQDGMIVQRITKE